MASQRIEVLDSLRGLASLQVVLLHLLSCFPVLSYLQNGWTAYLVYSPLSFLWDGPAAIVLFFVLSGFVLSIPYHQGRQSNYFHYAAKRIIRLYLPCAAIISLSLLCWYLLYTPRELVGFEDWLLAIWSQPMSAEYLRGVYLLDAFYGNIDSALWTLPIEIKLSLLLPAFLFLIGRLSSFWSYAVVVAYILFYHSAVFLGLIQYFPFLNILYYFSFFALGAVVSKHKEDFVGWFNKISATLFYLLVGIAVLLYTIIYTSWYLQEATIIILLNKVRDYMTGLSSVIFIGATLSDRFQTMMKSPVLLWLGKISFSLYLVHVVAIASTVYLLADILNMYLLFPCTVVSTFLLAILFYKWVEVPSLRLAKKISSSLMFKTTSY